MKTKIEIKSIWGTVLCSYESENNSISKTLKEALKNKASMRGADFRDADFTGADFTGADFTGADFTGADFRGADLTGADLTGADLNERTAFLLPQCPSEGAFIAWKKCNNHIIKLQITENAKRSSATSLKCRCSEALVLDIQTKEGSSSNIQRIQSDRDSEFIYEIGKISSVSDFDNNRWNECSTGIHFFISRQMAVKYNS